MDDKDSKTLEHISSILDTMLAIMQKPENKLLKIMAVIGNAVSIAGIIALIDIIRNW
jgi:predicted ATPase